MSTTDELVHTLRSFGLAYPEDMFGPVSEDERLLYGNLITRNSAAMGRHCAKFMAQAADMIEALSKPSAPVDARDALPDEPADFTAWWEGLAVAPCYPGIKRRIALHAWNSALASPEIIHKDTLRRIVAAARATPATVPIDTVMVTQADVEEARRLILDATATDLLSGNRKVVPEDRGTVYRWLCSAANLLLGEAQQAAPLDARLRVFDLQANWHKIGRDAKESSRLWYVLKEVEASVAAFVRQAAAPSSTAEFYELYERSVL